MYLVAGAITVVWAVVILFFLPPDPIRAKGFSERERYIAVARMRENNSGVRNKHFKIGQVAEALIDPRFWLIFSIAFLMMIANGPVSSFIPIIINGFVRTTNIYAKRQLTTAEGFQQVEFLAFDFASWRGHWYHRARGAVRCVQVQRYPDLDYRNMPVRYHSCEYLAMAVTKA